MVIKISYDLKKPGKDYSPLINAIKSLGDWYHALDSTWFVDTRLSVQEVGERLRVTIDENDRLVAVRVFRGQYAGWMEKAFWEWLNPRVEEPATLRSW